MNRIYLLELLVLRRFTSVDPGVCTVVATALHAIGWPRSLSLLRQLFDLCWFVCVILRNLTRSGNHFHPCCLFSALLGGGAAGEASGRCCWRICRESARNQRVSRFCSSPNSIIKLEDADFSESGGLIGCCRACGAPTRRT